MLLHGCSGASPLAQPALAIPTLVETRQGPWLLAFMSELPEDEFRNLSKLIFL